MAIMTRNQLGMIICLSIVVVCNLLIVAIQIVKLSR